MKFAVNMFVGSMLGFAMSASASAATENRDVVMTNFRYQYVAGGEGAIGVFAEIQLWSGDCVPSGSTAMIKTEVQDNVLIIYPEVKIENLGADSAETCVPSPQEVDVTIPAQGPHIDVIMVRNAYDIGAYLPLSMYQDDRIPSLDDLVQTADVLTDITLTPKNGGINPRFAAIEVSGTVVLGSNRCEARQFGVELRRTIIEGKTVVYAHRYPNTAVFPRVMCTREYMPVFAPVTMTLVGNSRFIPLIRIVNAETRGAVVRILDID